jgi:RecB family endonuclease NucS
LNDALDTGNQYVPLEKDLQKYLAANLEHALGEKLTLVRTEYPLQVGRVDIVAMDTAGNLVAIELKIGIAGRDALGQLQSYMGGLKAESPDKFVRGIIVAAGLDHQGQAAITVTRDIKFVSFSYSFAFKTEYEAHGSSEKESQLPIKKVWVPEKSYR